MYSSLPYSQHTVAWPTLIQTPKSKTAAADALVGLWTVALTAFLIATLYFARPILIPLALAALLTFLLSPLVTRIERWIGRIVAVLVVVTMIFTVTSVTGWVLTRQFIAVGLYFIGLPNAMLWGRRWITVARRWTTSSAPPSSRACATSSKTSARARPAPGRTILAEAGGPARHPPRRRTAAWYCLPARADRDELAGAGRAVQLLAEQGFRAHNASTKLLAGELVELVGKGDVDIVCISVVAPSTVIQARYLCLKLRALFPRQKIVIGLWGATEEDVTEAAGRLRDSGADEIVTTLAEALVQITRLAAPADLQMTAAPTPDDENQRLAALPR